VNQLSELIERLKSGKISEKDFETEILKIVPACSYIENVDNMTRFDVSRKERTGIPETVFSKNKSKEQLEKILEKVLPSQDFLFFTRIDSPKAEYLLTKKENYKEFDIIHEPTAETLLFKKTGFEFPKHGGIIAIFTAGTSDIPIAKEAQLIAEIAGCEVISFYDVGIAGIHRIFDPIKECIMKDVDCIIVVAGMEGTLPSVIATLIDVPVIGVPTSVGYGFHGEGISALSSILQSCSPGLAAVNIDNGFGAGAMASVISRRISKERNRKALDK